MSPTAAEIVELEREIKALDRDRKAIKHSGWSQQAKDAAYEKIDADIAAKQRQIDELKASRRSQVSPEGGED